MRRLFNVASSYTASGFRGVAGLWIGKLGPRPEQPVELYDFESCPWCRRVREALSMLDLDAKIFPCPRGGERFRPQVRERGGKELFPYFVDPNTGAEMFESADIVSYLYERYGAEPVPIILRGPLVGVSGTLSSVMRLGRGMRKVAARAPEEPLELYNFEASPFCRIVREELCVLEIPYLARNVAKGSKKREAFVARSGKMMVPYLVDPNTGTEMFESDDAVNYLRETYRL